MSVSGRDRLAFPLDYPDIAAARHAAEQLRESVGVIKVGLELFVRAGPESVALGRETGCEVFLDLKLHDIPATVDAATAAAAGHGVRYLTIHASGGSRMIEAAVNRAAKESTRLTVLAVTVLTSLDDTDVRALGVTATASDHALELARLAYRAGARGFVCSPLEVGRLRAEFGPEVTLVTPGIRAANSGDDQKRTASPAEAIRSGASLLVVGRPIRSAPDPVAAARRIVREIEEASP